MNTCCYFTQNDAIREHIRLHTTKLNYTKHWLYCGLKGQGCYPNMLRAQYLCTTAGWLSINRLLILNSCINKLEIKVLAIVYSRGHKRQRPASDTVIL